MKSRASRALPMRPASPSATPPKSLRRHRKRECRAPRTMASSVRSRASTASAPCSPDGCHVRDGSFLRDVPEPLRNVGSVPVARAGDHGVDGEHCTLDDSCRDVATWFPKLVELPIDEGDEPDAACSIPAKSPTALSPMRLAVSPESTIRTSRARTTPSHRPGARNLHAKRRSSPSRTDFSARRRSASGWPTSGGTTTMTALWLHLGPSRGSLSLTSTVTETGRNMRRRNASRVGRTRPPRSIFVSPSNRASTRRSSRGPDRITRSTSRIPWSSLAVQRTSIWSTSASRTARCASTSTLGGPSGTVVIRASRRRRCGHRRTGLQCEALRPCRARRSAQ